MVMSATSAHQPPIAHVAVTFPVFHAFFDVLSSSLPPFCGPLPHSLPVPLIPSESLPLPSLVCLQLRLYLSFHLPWLASLHTALHHLRLNCVARLRHSIHLDRFPFHPNPHEGGGVRLFQPALGGRGCRQN